MLQIAAVEVPEEYMGSVVELLGKRRGQMVNMEASGFVPSSHHFIRSLVKCLVTHFHHRMTYFLTSIFVAPSNPFLHVILFSVSYSFLLGVFSFQSINGCQYLLITPCAYKALSAIGNLNVCISSVSV